MGNNASQWQNMGSNFYYNLGYVVKGTSTPNATLSVTNKSITGIATPGSFQIGQSDTYNLVFDNNEVLADTTVPLVHCIYDIGVGDNRTCASGGPANFFCTVGININAYKTTEFPEMNLPTDRYTGFTDTNTKLMKMEKAKKKLSK